MIRKHWLLLLGSWLIEISRVRPKALPESIAGLPQGQLWNKWLQEKQMSAYEVTYRGEESYLAGPISAFCATKRDWAAMSASTSAMVNAEPPAWR